MNHQRKLSVLQVGSCSSPISVIGSTSWWQPCNPILQHLGVRCFVANVILEIFISLLSTIFETCNEMASWSEYQKNTRVKADAIIGGVENTAHR
jgi:hypothetical protein